jgi:hypothetical protein
MDGSVPADKITQTAARGGGGGRGRAMFLPRNMMDGLLHNYVRKQYPASQ